MKYVSCIQSSSGLFQKNIIALLTTESDRNIWIIYKHMFTFYVNSSHASKIILWHQLFIDTEKVMNMC